MWRRRGDHITPTRRDWVCLINAVPILEARPPSPRDEEMTLPCWGLICRHRASRRGSSTTCQGHTHFACAYATRLSG